jgi:hypothetical protein
MSRTAFSKLLIPSMAFFIALTAGAIVFPPDDRIDRYEIKDPFIADYARSTAAIAFASQLKKVTTASGPAFEVDFAVNGVGREQSEANCPLPAFLGQPSMISYCSSTLIGDDLLLTAGHCFDRGPTMTPESLCKRTVAIFDYAYRSAKDDPIRFPEANVFQCTKIEAMNTDREFDYAIIRLDRKVPGRTILKVRQGWDLGHFLPGTPFVASGYPKGFPNKTTEGTLVGYGGPARDTPVLHISTVGGNSGGSVVDPKTKLISGIVVSSDCADYVFTANDACYVEAVFHGECQGVRVIPSERIVDQAYPFFIH